VALGDLDLALVALSNGADEPPEPGLVMLSPMRHGGRTFFSPIRAAKGLARRSGERRAVPERGPRRQQRPAVTGHGPSAAPPAGNARRTWTRGPEHPSSGRGQLIRT